MTDDLDVLRPGVVDPVSRRTSRIGLGLLLSLPVGGPVLVGAVASGGDGFEWAVARFVLSVAVAVGGVLFVGRLYDAFTEANIRRGILLARAASAGGTDPGSPGATR
jgi:hypothetical protein